QLFILYLGAEFNLQTIDIIDLSLGCHNVKNVDIDINVKLDIFELDDIKPVDVPHFNFDIDVFECHIFDLTSLILSSQTLTSQTSTSQTSSSQTSTSNNASTQTSTSSRSTSSGISITSTPTTSTSNTFSLISSTSSIASASTPTNGWKTLGCYKDGPLGKAVSPYISRYATDLMVIEICLSHCRSKGTTYAGIEYRSTPNTAGCTLTCKSDATDICGGSLHMNVYQAISEAGSFTISSPSSSSSSPTSTTTSKPSSSVSTTTSRPSSFTSPLSTSATTTSSTLTTSTRTSSSSSAVTYITPTPSATGFYSLGCYAEPPAPTKKNLTQLLSSDTMSPDVCMSALSSANNKVGATKTYNVFALEYGKECWAGEGLVKTLTSLAGNLACRIGL
ncbi:MAG: hypothetical protein Q9192_007107, partial [Flavoplaca navasiana]